MSVTQSNYLETHAPGAAGLCATTRHNERDSLVVEGADTEIPFGYVVSHTATDGNGKAGNGDMAGIALMDKTLIASQNDKFVAGDVVGVLWRGEIWVEARGSVARGDAVTVDANGQCGSDGVSAVAVTAAGSSYADAATPAVTFSGGGGSGATATAEADSANGLIAITVTNGGSGYTSAPTVAVAGSGTATASLGETLNNAEFVKGNSARGGLAIVRIG